MKKYIVLFLLSIIYINIYSQIYNKNFYFFEYSVYNKSPFHGTRIDFGQYPPAIDTNVQFWYIPGVPGPNQDAVTPQTVLSDSMGNTRFYADMYRVWNKSHTLLYNKNDSGEFYQNPCAEYGLLAPVPNNDSLVYYFNFSQGCYYYYWNQVYEYALQVFTINQHKDSGRGGCIEKYKIINTNIMPAGVLMKHRNGRDYWLVVKKYNTIDYLSYLITPSGIDTVNYVFSSNSRLTFTSNKYNYNCIMKASLDGKSIVTTVILTSGKTEIMDFNDSTGELTNSRLIEQNEVFELSPSGKKLYMLDQVDKLYIYDLNQTNDSALEATKVKYPIAPLKIYSAIQLMPDCRIMIYNRAKTHWAIINYPNEDSANIEYDSMGFYRDTKIWTFDGMFIATPPAWSIIPKGMRRNSATGSTVCHTDSAEVKLKTCSPGRYTWIWGDGDTLITYDSAVSAKHLYAHAGTYQVQINIKNPCGIDTVFAVVYVTPKPMLFLGNDTVFCERNQVFSISGYLPGNYHYQWNTGDTTAQINTTQSGWYSLKASNGICQLQDTLKVNRQNPPVVRLYSNYYKCSTDSIYLDVKNLQSTIQWSHGDTSHTTYIAQPGNYTVSVSEGVCTTTDSFRVTNYSTKKPLIITMSADSIIIPNQYKNYQWYNKHVVMPSDTHHYLKLTQAGMYHCKATDQNNCTTYSDTTSIRLATNTIYKNTGKIYPVPSGGILVIEMQQAADVKIVLNSVTGKKLYEQLYTEQKITLDMSQLPASIYILQIISRDKMEEYRVIKE